MSRRFLLFFGLWLCAAARLSASAAGDVVCVDFWELAKNEGAVRIEERANLAYALMSLQGIANRNAPRLYVFAAKNLLKMELRSKYVPVGTHPEAEDLDRQWWHYLCDKGFVRESQTRTVSSLAELFKIFEGEFSGFAVWGDSTGALSNVALSVAGAESKIALSSTLDGGSLLKKLRAQFPNRDVLYLDAMLPEKSPENYESLKVAAYQFLKARYLDTGKLNPAYFVFMADADCWKRRHFYNRWLYEHLGDQNELQQNGIFNADYWVSKAAAFIDWQPNDRYPPSDDVAQKKGGDLSLWHSFLKSAYKLRGGEFGMMGGFVPWWLKYAELAGGSEKDPVRLEQDFIRLCTSYNLWNDGDAAFGIANASFFQHYPKPSPERFQAPVGRGPSPKKGVLYLCFFMLDYDGSAWLNQAARAVFDTPRRGELPLNWAINPVLAERVPHAFDYMLERKTPQDFFGILDDGVGYIDANMLIGEKRVGTVKTDGFSAYARAAKPYLAAQKISISAFYIAPDGYDRRWAETLGALTPRGLGTNVDIAPQLARGVPIVWLEECHHSRIADFNARLLTLFQQASGRAADTPQFAAMRCILMTPEEIVQACAQARAAYPKARVEILNAYHFFDAIKSAAKREAIPVIAH